MHLAVKKVNWSVTCLVTEALSAKSRRNGGVEAGTGRLSLPAPDGSVFALRCLPLLIIDLRLNIC